MSGPVLAFSNQRPKRQRRPKQKLSIVAKVEYLATLREIPSWLESMVEGMIESASGRDCASISVDDPRGA